MKLTAATEFLRGCKMREVLHGHGDKQFLYIYEVVEHPRLTRRDVYTRSTRAVESTWCIDGVDATSLEDAVAGLQQPPVLYPEEQQALLAFEHDDYRRHRDCDYSIRWSLARKGVIEHDGAGGSRRAKGQAWRQPTADEQAARDAAES